MEITEIQKIIELMNENGLTEVDLELSGNKIRLKKELPAAPTIIQAAPAPAPVAAAPALAPILTPISDNSPAEPLGPSIDSPMVGTFYRASGPSEADFVKVGDTVTEDTTVCIIEAMKVMNEIKAETRGVIKKILIENGNPVQYGEALFELE